MSFYYSQRERHELGRKRVAWVERCETGAKRSLLQCSHDWRRRTREIVRSRPVLDNLDREVSEKKTMYHNFVNYEESLNSI